MEEVEEEVMMDQPLENGKPAPALVHKRFDRNVIIEDRVDDEHKKKITYKIYTFIESTPVIIFMMVVTIWALFGDDIRQVTVDVNGDFTFYMLTLICFVLFAAEIILSVIAKPDYRWGFFFYLDVVSTLSLLMDVGFISDLIMGDTGSGNGSAKSAASFAKTARASRIGTRAGRIVRIIRLIRLIRIVKLYKASQQAQEKRNEKKKSENSKKGTSQTNKEGSQRNKLQDDNRSEGGRSEVDRKSSSANLGQSEKNLTDNKSSTKHLEDSEYKLGSSDKPEGLSDLGDPDDDEVFEETKVGKKLSDLTTKRVIILILSIMISIPVFSTDTYFSVYTSYQSGIQNLLFLFNLDKNVSSNAPFRTAWKNFLEIHTDPEENVVLKRISFSLKTASDELDIDITPTILDATNTNDLLKPLDLDSLRSYEKKTVVEPEDAVNVGSYFILADFDQSKESDLNGYLGIGRTIFVCVVLTASAMFFSKDANELVLAPIEKMLSKVKRISKNPLTAVKIEEEYDVIWEDIKDKRGERKRKDQENFETTILEKTIVKIGALLALGFGEAGSQIVANNLQSDGEIDHMLPGQKVVALFGYVDIKNFTMVTEVLQEGIMIFVNEIADIVHTVIDQYSGSSNKNIGDSFLFVWKFAPEDCLENIENQTFTVRKTSKSQGLTELALMSIVNVQARIIRSARLDKYRYNPNLISRLGNNAQEFRVRMGFGLHQGWAIESAIGSEFKIDASYLSPHVNVASRLEGLTKAYGASILLSDDVADMLREAHQGLLRQVDRVRLKGMNDAVGLYTIDLNTAAGILPVDASEDKEMSSFNKKKKRVAMRSERDMRRKDYTVGKATENELLTKQKDLLKMREIFTQDFYMEWDQGMAAYLEGDFRTAAGFFEKTENMIPNHTDKVSTKLLSYLRECDYQAPAGWEGGKELAEGEF